MRTISILLHLDEDLLGQIEGLEVVRPTPTRSALLRYLLRNGVRLQQMTGAPVPRLMKNGLLWEEMVPDHARPIAIRATPAPDPEPQRGSYSFLAAASEEHQATLREIEPLRESDPVRHNRERILADKRLAAAMNGTEYELQPEDIGLDADGAKP